MLIRKERNQKLKSQRIVIRTSTCTLLAKLPERENGKKAQEKMIRETLVDE